MKTIKIKCLKDDTLEVIEISWFAGIEKFLTDHWASMNRLDWYEVVEE
jgi:hypothetical protein